MKLRASLAALAAVIVAGTIPIQSTTRYGECGYLMVDGGGNGAYAYGWAELVGNTYLSGCEDVTTLVQVRVWSPLGTFNYGSDSRPYGYAYAQANVALALGESGFLTVHGEGWLFHPLGGGEYLDAFAYPLVEGYPIPPPTSNVWGRVFYDSNQNQQFDEGEAPVADTTVYLTDASGSTPYGHTQTGSDGMYSFLNLPQGAYRVTHPVPSGYTKTTDDSRAFTVPPDWSWNFGIAPAVQLSSVSGRVFVDYNQNGVFDESDDEPVANTTVYLTDPTESTTYGTIPTDFDGTYRFDHLGGEEGSSYRVTHEVPDGYVRTTDDSVVFPVPPDFAHDFGLAPAQGQSCRTPNVLPRAGVVRSRDYTYFVSTSTGFTPDEVQGIVDAFDLWRTADAGAGTGTTFTQSMVTPATIMIYKEALPRRAKLTTAGTSVTPEAGPLSTGTIVYNSDRIVNPPNPGELYVRKIFLHEIGHLHALEDTPNVPALTTVMIDGVPIASIPADVTSCDANRAFQKSVQ